MNKLTRLKISLNIIIISACISIANEIKTIEIKFINDNLTKLIVIVLSIVTAIILEKMLLVLIVKFKIFRKLILGNTWLEGCWIIDVYDMKEKIITSGLAIGTYSQPNLQHLISAYFPNGIRDKKPIYSVSKDIYLREDDLLYINYFTSNTGLSTLVGVAVGHFIVEYDFKFPTKFNGIIYYNDGKQPVKQVLTKLSNSQIKESKKHKNWKETIINTYGKYQSK